MGQDAAPSQKEEDGIGSVKKNLHHLLRYNRELNVQALSFCDQLE